MPYEIGRSLPPKTATTPGSARALEKSMLLIIAWGRWLRRILQANMRGKTMSSANFVCPTHLARASTLRKGLPTKFSGLPFLLMLFFQPQMNTDKSGFKDQQNKLSLILIVLSVSIRVDLWRIFTPSHTHSLAAVLLPHHASAPWPTQLLHKS